MSGAAVFDFDGTVIRGDSIVALTRLAQRRGYISVAAALWAGTCGVLYHLGLMEEMSVKRRGHAFLTRLSPAEREELLRGFAQSLADRAYSEALARMRAHRAAGDKVVLCSASCSCYMQYVATLLPVDALLCTPSAADGGALGPNCRGVEKVRRVRAWLAEEGLPPDSIVAAYGDSKGDMYILRESRRPVLVNPKRALRRRMPEAERVQWGKGK